MKIIEALFAQMSLLYGAKWADTFSDERAMEFAKDSWLRCLQEFSTATVERAIKKLFKGDHNHKTWPPTAFEFQDICRSVRSDNDSQNFLKLTSKEEMITRDKTMHDLVKIKNNCGIDKAIFLAKRCKFSDIDISDLFDCDLEKVASVA